MTEMASNSDIVSQRSYPRRLKLTIQKKRRIRRDRFIGQMVFERLLARLAERPGSSHGRPDGTFVGVRGNLLKDMVGHIAKGGRKEGHDVMGVCPGDSARER